MDEYDTLLLTAVHNADLTTVQTCLSSVADPNIYLNRVYDQSNEQKCTLLMIACLNGYEDIVSIILDNFKPDLEILNIIQIENKDKQPEVYKDVTILWAAAAINHFLIVKRLVEGGADINHSTSTNSTAARCACYNGNMHMLRYLVENGANVHINNSTNNTNVALVVYHKHLKVLAYLVDELGCDIDECDNDGRSPLYFAVKSKSLQIVAFLIYHGVRVVSQISDRRSPLRLAAETRCYDIVKAILPYCSLIDQIEAEELLGSSFACAEYGPCDLRQSYEHYHRAMQLRLDQNLSKTIIYSPKEVFNNRHECQTLDELEELRQNSENMYIEALLVRERLLGPISKKYRYSLIYRGVVLANQGKFDQTVALWLYELALCHQYSIKINQNGLRIFTAMLCEIINQSLSPSSEAFLTIATTIVEEVKHNSDNIDYNLYTLLFLTTGINQPSVNSLMSFNDRIAFYRLLRFINQTPYTTVHSKSSLLHLTLNDKTSASDVLIDGICKYPCLSTVRTLLQCGADVNASDAVGNTPLHILASNSSVCNESILDLLCDSGAHLDYTNALGEIPIDVVFNSNTKQLLKSRMKIKLKCICARLIRENDIPFDGKIVTSLVNFVKRH